MTSNKEVRATGVVRFSPVFTSTCFDVADFVKVELFSEFGETQAVENIEYFKYVSSLLKIFLP